MLNGRVADGKTIYQIQPEQESTDISISPQVSGIFSEDKRAIVLAIDNGLIDDGIRLRVIIGQAVKHTASPDNSAARLSEKIDQSAALRRKVNTDVVPNCGQNRINKCWTIKAERVLRAERLSCSRR